MRFLTMFLNAMKLGWWALTNPQTVSPGNFKMLSDLLMMILKVSTEDRHMMMHLACVHPDEGEKQIVSIWAGAGIGAEPVKRISELIEENSRLKTRLSHNAHNNSTHWDKIEEHLNEEGCLDLGEAIDILKSEFKPPEKL